MINKKFFPAAVLSFAVLFTACSAGSTEGTETVSETIYEAVTTTAAETASTISETNTEATTVTTTAAAEIIDTSSVEYIKEALQAEWDEDVAAVNLYTADLNGDGVKELLVNYALGSAMNGFVYVYDVSDGVKKLYEIPARIWRGNSGLYTDEDGKTHFIHENFYSSLSSSECDRAIFDISYDELKQPFFADVYDWYNGGAHIHEYDLYKNCEIVPDAEVFDGWRNFDSEKAEYIGRYNFFDVLDAFDNQEENEVREIIQKEVYYGMTYVSDIEEIYKNSGYDKNYRVVWDFEEFWQEAALKLAEVYSGAAATKIIDTSGVEYMKEALQAEWNKYMGVAELYAADLNGDGVNELFVKYLVQPLKDGVIYVYDVSDGMKKLYEISARSSVGSELYTDENNIVHYIFWSDYVGSIWEGNYAYFDVTYDSIKIPFYVDVHGWFDGGAHVFDDIIYKNCEFVPTNEMNRNFDSEKAELVGTFEYKDIHAVFDDGESNEVSEIIQKEVYDGLTYSSDITYIYFGSSYNDDFEDFDSFWQEAAPKLAEIYG